MRNNKKGFTLAELTISLAILGIIASGLMLLTASTVSKTYNRRINYLFKNECQNVANCFSISDLYLDSSNGELNCESLLSSLEFYFEDNVTYSEYTEDGLPEHTFSVIETKYAGKLIISWGYDVSFKQSPDSTQYTFSLLVKYNDDVGETYNEATLSMFICKGNEVITDILMAEDNDKLVYSQVECIAKEVPTK